MVILIPSFIPKALVALLLRCQFLPRSFWRILDVSGEASVIFRQLVGMVEFFEELVAKSWKCS